MEDIKGDTSMQTSFRQKQPLRRLQNALNSCVNVAIPLHIELLNKHKANIEKFQELQEWNKLHKEQINASRTVEQLKADVWSLDMLRSQVDNTSLHDFDKQIKKSQELVTLALQQFVTMEKDQSVDRTKLNDYEERPVTEVTVALEALQESKFAELDTENMLLQDLAQAREREESWNDLVRDCRDLNESMLLLSSYVHQQEEPLNSIDANIEMASDNLSKGNAFLAKAVKYKAIVYPLGGALIGTCIAGPVGLFVGLKTGAVAGVLGSVLGFQSGRFFKKKVQRSADLEMYKLEQQKCIDGYNNGRHASLPDLRFTEIEDDIICVEKVAPSLGHL